VVAGALEGEKKGQGVGGREGGAKREGGEKGCLQEKRGRLLPY